LKHLLTFENFTANGAPIECCDQESVPIQPRYLHESCHPLVIPSDDQHYRPLRVTCLNYVRSALAIHSASCKFGSIDQVSSLRFKSFFKQKAKHFSSFLSDVQLKRHRIKSISNQLTASKINAFLKVKAVNYLFFLTAIISKSLNRHFYLVESSYKQT
jgi:hypothetical protein